jgi:amino acid transporter
MFNLLLIAFVIAAFTIILALSVVGAFIFRKKSSNPPPQIDQAKVIDVTPKDSE